MDKTTQEISNRARRARRAAFTLLELLVVIVLVCLLAGMVFRMLGAATGQDKIAETKAILQKVSLALERYKSIYGKYPPVPNYGKVKSAAEGEQGDVRGFTDGIGQPVAFSWPAVPSGLKGSGLTFDKTEAAQIAAIDKASPLDWSKNCLFTFGLVSFFVPRYNYATSHGCPTELLGVPSDNPPANWGGAGHAVQQWQTYNKRRADSAIGDSARDVNAARSILPFLDAELDSSGNLAKNGIMEECKDDFSFAARQVLETPGGTFTVPIRTLRILDAFVNPNDINVVQAHIIRYLSRPPYESYELRSSGPNGVFYDDDDIVIGSK